MNYFGLVPDDASHPPSSSSSSSSSPSALAAMARRSRLFLVDLPGFGYASAPDANVDEWQERTQRFLISRASPAEPSSSHADGEGEGDDDSRGRRPDGGYGDFGSSGSDRQRRRQGRQGPPPLKRLYLLLDSRLPDVSLLDLSVMGWCDEYYIPYTIVLTKVDGTSRALCAKLTNQLCMRYHSLYVEANETSTTASNRGDDTDNDDDDDGGGGEVFMDPVVYWTSSKDGLGMEELLLSVENSMIATEEDYDDDGASDYDDGEGEHLIESEEGVANSRL